MRLRKATQEDIHAIVGMGPGMIAESSFAGMSYSPEKVARAITECGFACVAVDGDVVAGVILGDIVAPWFSEDRMGTERVLYVRPEYRGTRAALMLVKAWIVWCWECGAKQIRPGTSATSEAADRLYRAIEFEPAGTLYVMRKD